MKQLIILVLAILYLFSYNTLVDDKQNNTYFEEIKESEDLSVGYLESTTEEKLLKVLKIEKSSESPSEETYKQIVWTKENHPCWVEEYGYYIHASLEDWVCTCCYDTITPRYGFTEDEIYLLSQLLAGDKNKDGDGEYDFTWDIQNGYDVDYEQISLVLCVVMNRIRNEQFPDTIEEVLLQKGQFVVFPRNLKADPDPLVIEVIRGWCQAYDEWSTSVQTIPEDHLYFCSNGKLKNISRTSWR